MKRALIYLRAAFAVCLALAPAAAIAGSSTGTLTVNASVVAKCTVTAATLAFTNWDFVTYGAANDDASQALSFTCTKGSSSVYVTADVGANSTHATGTTRAMVSGSNYLSYELYTDSGYSTVWNTTNSGGHTFAPSFASSHSATATVYAQIPSGQDVPVGSYSDSVTMTINF